MICSDRNSKRIFYCTNEGELGCNVRGLVGYSKLRNPKTIFSRTIAAEKRVVMLSTFGETDALELFSISCRNHHLLQLHRPGSHRMQPVSQLLLFSINKIQLGLAGRMNGCPYICLFAVSGYKLVILNADLISHWKTDFLNERRLQGIMGIIHLRERDSKNCCQLLIYGNDLRQFTIRV